MSSTFKTSEFVNIDTLDFEKDGGLLPAVVQDAQSGRVLMLGYMNREAVERTLELGKVTFYSRSKKRLWTKGETSGNILNLVDIQPDCDNDTLLILTAPEGPTCHTGADSCFHRKEFTPGGAVGFLAELEALIRSRRDEMPEGSYTARLFEEGIDMIAQKVGEEAVETVIASKNDAADEFTGEAADLLYHLMILLVERDSSLEEVAERLRKRNRNQPSTR